MLAVAAATAAADTGNLCGFSMKGPSALQAGLFVAPFTDGSNVGAPPRKYSCG
jgi:hypothetical protein